MNWLFSIGSMSWFAIRYWSAAGWRCTGHRLWTRPAVWWASWQEFQVCRHVTSLLVINSLYCVIAFSAFTLLAGHYEIEWQSISMWLSSVTTEVRMICMLSIQCHCDHILLCIIKIQKGYVSFLVLSYRGFHGKRGFIGVYYCCRVLR